MQVLIEPIPVTAWMTEIDKWLIREQTFLPQRIREQLEDAITSCPDPVFVRMVYPLALECAHDADDQPQLPSDVAGIVRRNAHLPANKWRGKLEADVGTSRERF